jgi:DNA adenine methylase
LYFSVRPSGGVIADSNPELVNLYQSVADNVEEVITLLAECRNSEDAFYAIRALDYTTLSPTEAAARTIFLNRTCFNGLLQKSQDSG